MDYSSILLETIIQTWVIWKISSEHIRLESKLWILGWALEQLLSSELLPFSWETHVTVRVWAGLYGSHFWKIKGEADEIKLQIGFWGKVE